MATQACLGTGPDTCDIRSAAIAEASRILWRGLPAFNTSAVWLRLTACNQASLCTTWRPATPLLIDQEPPEVNLTIEGPVQCPSLAYRCDTVWLDRAHPVTAHVSLADMGSALQHCVWGIGGLARADNVQRFAPVPGAAGALRHTGTLTAAQPLPEAMPLYITVRCQDPVARTTTRAMPVAVVSMAPGAAEAVVHLSRAAAPSPLPATEVAWSGFDVFAPALVEYLVAVGRQPGHADLMTWTAVGNRTDYVLTNLTLPAGPVWVSVKAQYPSLRASTSSSRLLIDSSPPIPGTVQRLTRPLLAPQCAANVSALEVQWSGFEDSASFVASYDFAVVPANSAVTPQWHNVGRRTYASVEPQQREPGEYRVLVRATDAAGNQVQSGLDFMVDGSEPQMPVCVCSARMCVRVCV